MPTRMLPPVAGKIWSRRRCALAESAGRALSIRVMARPSATLSPALMASASASVLLSSLLPLMASGVGANAPQRNIDYYGWIVDYHD
jgi:hypothetical protein